MRRHAARRWACLVSLLLVPLACRAGDNSPDGRWRIEITKAATADPMNGTTPTPRERLMLLDLATKRAQVVWDKTSWWLPSPKDSARAVWREDSRAFTLPDIARKWNGFSVYVLTPVNWRRAYQSNSFIDQIPRVWGLTYAQFPAAQFGGVVSDLKWGPGGTLHFKFWSFDQTDTLITEILTREDTKPEVAYVSGARDKSAMPPLTAMKSARR